MHNAKYEVAKVLQGLPDSCSLEDVQYSLYVLEKVHHGLEVADREGVLTHETVVGRLKKWLVK